MRRKRIIEFDMTEEPLLTQVFNDVTIDGYSKIKYDNNRDKWQKLSGRLRAKKECKQLIEEEFILPPTKSRYHQIGVIVKPKDIDIQKEINGEKIKFTFNRKMF